MARALGRTAALKPHCSFSRWFSLPGVSSGFPTCTSIKFRNRVERKEMDITEYLLLARLETLCRRLVSPTTCKFGAVNLIQRDSFRKSQQIDQGLTDNQWWSQVQSSDPLTAKSDASTAPSPDPGPTRGFWVGRVHARHLHLTSRNSSV